VFLRVFYAIAFRIVFLLFLPPNLTPTYFEISR